MITVIQGDMLEELPKLVADSLDSCVCDPPYHLTSIVKRFGSSTAAPAKGNAVFERSSRGFMGKTWDGGDIASQPGTWAEVFRVLKPGAYLLAFGGTRTAHRMACAIEDAGFEIRDTLCWLYGTGFPKSLDVSKAIDKAACATREVIGMKRYGDGNRTYNGGAAAARTGGGIMGEAAERGPSLKTAPATPEAAQWQGWGTALKPAFEPIIVARKPLGERTVAANVLAHGTGALNIDACRIPLAEDDKLQDGVQHAAHALDRSGAWGFKAVDRAAGLGRVPANVIHDGSDEVEAAFAAFGERPGQQGLAKTDGTPSTNLIYGAMKHGTLQPVPRGDSGTSSRFFKECKWSEAELNASINVSDADQTFAPRSQQFASALSHAVAQSMQPWGLSPQSYQGQNTSVSVLELRMACGSVTALIQNIALRCAHEWPHTNITLDNSPVVCVARPKQTGIMTITISLSKSDGFAEVATFSIMQTNMEPGAPDLAGGKRFHYSAKADAADRLQSKHPTVKPVDLMRWLVRMVTPPGGTVLDPFAGSGTTGMAALAEGFNAVLIERESEYVADIRRRIAHVIGSDTPLFSTSIEPGDIFE